MLHMMPSSSDNNSKSMDAIELRSRGVKNLAFRSENNLSPIGTNGSNFGNRVMIEHKIQSGETLNTIALQYSVQVAEIKRANGLVSDQEIFALQNIRIPVSRLQREIFLTNADSKAEPSLLHHSNSASSSLIHYDTLSTVESMSNSNFMLHAGVHQTMDDSKVPLLSYDDDSGDEMEYSEQSDKKHTSKKQFENLLEKTDATVAAVRENLSEKSPTLEGGAFHFIDATAPDTESSKGIWFLLISVIFIFVVIPLLLTMLEEKNEAESLHIHQQHSLGSHHDSGLIDRPHHSHLDSSA